MTCPTAARIARGYDEATLKTSLEAAGVSFPAERHPAAGSYRRDNDNRPSRATLDDLVGIPTYVATPYTNYAHGHAAAAYDAAVVTAKLMRMGIPAFSPIAHSHAVAHAGGLDKVDGDFWQVMDAPWLRLAEACVVVMMPGWETSHGVQHEFGEFRRAGKPLVFMEWGDAQADRRAA